MTVEGRWRIVAMPDYETDYPDMMEPACILFDRGDKANFTARPRATSSTAC